MSLFFKIILTILASIFGLFVLWYVFLFLMWVVFSIVSLTVNKKKEYSEPAWWSQKWFNFGYRILILGGRIRIKATGLENIPENDCFLFVSNHRSKFDNMVQALKIIKKQKLLFISKPENFKIPFGGRLMIRNCYLPIERNNPKSGLLTVLKASDFIKSQKSSVAVFPEGTRCQTGELLPFKPGCFKIAQKAKCPIVVGCIQGTEKVHKNFPLKKSIVNLDIIKVIQPEEFEGKNTIQISDEIYEMMNAFINGGQQKGEN